MLVALVALSASLLSLLSSSSALTAICTFKGDGVGQLTGDILLTEHETPDGTAIEIAGEVMNLSPGEHGFHIHEAGDLSDDCKGAGGDEPQPWRARLSHSRGWRPLRRLQGGRRSLQSFWEEPRSSRSRGEARRGPRQRGRQ